MDAFLARLDRRFGKLAIENLATFIVGGMGIVFLLSMVRPDFQSLLVLDMHQVMRGQVWRLVTYLFLSSSSSLIWILFELYWVWMIVSNLESAWGPFKLNVYYLLGMIGTTVAAILTGGAVGNEQLNLSCFFAFATLFPSYEILVFFVLPVKMKWLGLLSAAYAVYEVVTGNWVTRGAIIAATANYFVFFGPHLLGLMRSRNLETRQAARRVSAAPAPSHGSTMAARACAICGKGEDDDADIRYCACEKCLAAGGPRNLCLEHARHH
jgi:membrane associated rhomboid family serine protease